MQFVFCNALVDQFAANVLAKLFSRFQTLCHAKPRPVLGCIATSDLSDAKKKKGKILHDFNCEIVSECLCLSLSLSLSFSPPLSLIYSLPSYLLVLSWAQRLVYNCPLVDAFNTYK